MYEKITRDIFITVRPVFLEEQSEPDRNHFVWAYRINILNQGEETVQLINRHWQITDKFGHLQEVKGPGVVGQQPILKPGASYDYTSGCPLGTPSGIMVGTYEMATQEGARFLVEIPAFSLDCPHDSASIN